jgi:5-methylcytosine-specific restriction endonuclease McrA
MRTELRQLVYVRDHRMCRLCGRPIPLSLMELDHIRPVNQGGVLSLANVRAACRPCNRRRGQVWQQRLRRVGRLWSLQAGDWQQRLAAQRARRPQ